MDVFRNLYLQRTLSVLILFVALFAQIQTLYACESMEGKPRHVCCCGEQDSVSCPIANSCAMHEQTAETSCCEVSYATLYDVGMINNASTVDTLTLLLDGPQPPPVIEFQNFSPAPLQKLLQLSLAEYEPPILSRGQYTYLLTRRLRL